MSNLTYNDMRSNTSASDRLYKLLNGKPFDHKNCVEHCNIYVDGGSLSSPYYNFYFDKEATKQFKILDMDITKTYKFHRLDEAITHPFYISDVGVNQPSSDKILIIGDGAPTTGITGTQTFILKFKQSFSINSTLTYYCTSHSSMTSTFNMITSAVPRKENNLTTHNNENTNVNYSKHVGTSSDKVYSIRKNLKCNGC